jgi:hypothetical protein
MMMGFAVPPLGCFHVRAPHPVQNSEPNGIGFAHDEQDADMVMRESRRRRLRSYRGNAYVLMPPADDTESMMKPDKSAKLAARHLRDGETLFGCWKGSPNTVNPLLRGAIPLGLIGAGVNLAADVGQHHYYVFATDQRIIFERIKLGVTSPRRTEEVYAWKLADISNFRVESPKALSAPMGTKWLRFDSRSGPASMLLNGASRDDFAPIFTAIEQAKASAPAGAGREQSAATRFCVSCGAQAAGGWAFCNRCGAAIPAA